MTQATPNYGSFYGPMQEGYVLYVYTKFEADSSIHSNIIGGPKTLKLGHVTQATPTQESFYGPHTGGVRPLCLYQIWSW